MTKYARSDKHFAIIDGLEAAWKEKNCKMTLSGCRMRKKRDALVRAIARKHEEHEEMLF